jgi:ABC-type bacteriocin/lantibiotic exporter with double-glycine peptidase domain
VKNLERGPESFGRKPGFFTILALTLVVTRPVFVPAHAAAKGFYVEVPYVRQARNYCGPAALAMVLRYWGQPADQNTLAGAFRPFPPRGLSGAQLKELAASYHFAAHSFSGSSEAILDHLSKGRPLIVAVSSSQLLNLNHYLVVVGWDAEKRNWIVHDPSDGPYRRLSEKSFLDRWGDLKNWTLLVLPAGGK